MTREGQKCSKEYYANFIYSFSSLAQPFFATSLMHVHLYCSTLRLPQMIEKAKKVNYSKPPKFSNLHPFTWNSPHLQRKGGWLVWRYWAKFSESWRSWICSRGSSGWRRASVGRDGGGMNEVNNANHQDNSGNGCSFSNYYYWTSHYSYIKHTYPLQCALFPHCQCQHCICHFLCHNLCHTEQPKCDNHHTLDTSIHLHTCLSVHLEICPSHLHLWLGPKPL